MDFLAIYLRISVPACAGVVKDQNAIYPAPGKTGIIG
jgi:hypothetical protein